MQQTFFDNMLYHAELCWPFVVLVTMAVIVVCDRGCLWLVGWVGGVWCWGIGVLVCVVGGTFRLK